MKLAANLDWLYGHETLEKRFEAAARDGFFGVEILQPYDRTPQWYAQALEHNGLEAVLVNTPVGEGAGRLGLAAVPGAQATFREGFLRAIEVAAILRCPAIHVMAGAVAGFEPASCRDTLIGNLEAALPFAENNGIRLTLEPLNRVDAPGYFYSVPEQALEIVRRLDSSWLALQFDFYHCVREALDPLAEVTRAAGWIGHTQIGGAPDRHEPDLAGGRLLDALGALNDSGYAGWIGCEYRPRGEPAQGLQWCAPLRRNGWLLR